MNDERRLIGRHSGFSQYLRQNSETDFAYEFVANVEPTLDFCHAMQADGNRGYSESRDIQHLASYPPIVIEIFKQRWGADPLAKGNEDLLLRMLNDPDLKHLRTSTGTV